MGHPGTEGRRDRAGQEDPQQVPKMDDWLSKGGRESRLCVPVSPNRETGDR